MKINQRLIYFVSITFVSVIFLFGVKANALSLESLMNEDQESSSRGSQASGFQANGSQASSTAAFEEAIKTEAAKAETKPELSISIGAMMDKTPTKQGELSLENIYQGRSQHQLMTAKQELVSLNNQLRSDCSCSLSSSNACYDFNARSLGLTQKNVISAANEANQILTNQSKTICQSWNNAKNFASDDPQAMQQQVVVIKRYKSLLNEVEKASQETAQKLTKQNRQIEAAIAQQEEDSGFDWGKAMAMGVGALAGGLGELDINSQTEIISSIIQDSYSNDSSMNNLQATVNGLNSQMKQASASQNSLSSGQTNGSGQTQSFSIDFVYRDSCPSPSSTKINAPIKTNSQACANAMKHYAKAASCNLIDDLEAAQSAYYSACASEIYQ
ncbi:hypothetical protein CYL31_13210 [Marinomonas sp. A3A]|uniref:hypothetical protein n=1 Tax=Marinomonas sp. A3A TaxID=2065312 RepID=UPI001BB32F0C|nr:hypothetical protein [Marinomonas sp. A3A]QUX92299.1 hypothetical protein CYL31_13210 [Marinomonas sp. A3A]